MLGVFLSFFHVFFSFLFPPQCRVMAGLPLGRDGAEWRAAAEVGIPAVTSLAHPAEKFN